MEVDLLVFLIESSSPLGQPGGNPPGFPDENPGSSKSIWTPGDLPWSPGGFGPAGLPGPQCFSLGTKYKK